MPACQFLHEPDGGVVAVLGLRVRSILSRELFCDHSGLPDGSPPALIAHACHDRWTDLANMLSLLPEPAELLLLVGKGDEQENARPEMLVGFLVPGRGDTPETAERAARSAFAQLRTLLAGSLDYADLEAITESDVLETACALLTAPHVVELRRRLEPVRVSHAFGRTLGFGTFRRVARSERRKRNKKSQRNQRSERTPDRFETVIERKAEPDDEALTLQHLFPWIPSDDPWHHLLDTLSAEPGAAALIVHVLGHARAPGKALHYARGNLSAAERMKSLQVELEQQETVLQHQAGILQNEAMRRLVTLEGHVVACRVFLASGSPASHALVACTLGCVSDASTTSGQPGTESIFLGGARTQNVPAPQILAPLDEPDFDVLFSPREVSAVLRTPMPTDRELRGLAVKRARTAPMIGVSGTDAPLGENVAAGARVPVALDDRTRFRHTYVVGQTGTGKSTLLLHMILHDLARGRGVCVLDPHGSLIEDVVARLPAERSDDVVLVDATDTEYPVGFNVLSIDEDDPDAYRQVRDLLIDDLYGFVDRTYDMRLTGGPMFETHFRGMLALLLGNRAPEPPMIPNLMVFRALYTNDKLRERLTRSVRGEDPVVDEFLAEAAKARGEGSLANIAPYITSKLTRFISDHALQNLTCQHRMLGFDEIVREGKVLLVHLGKGRFGDYASGLLASQIVSRIRNAIMKRGSRSEGKPFYLYADEFQLFADVRFAEMLAEARKFGLALTLAHQYAEQIPEQVLKSVLGNVGTVVALRVGARDGAIFDPLFQPVFGGRDLTSLPNFQAYVRSFGGLGNIPFSVEIGRPPDVTGENPSEGIRDRSREQFARPRAEVEEEIRVAYDGFMGVGTTSK